MKKKFMTAFQNFKIIFRVVSGNFLEMFDFFVFGFFATSISKCFFPMQSEYAALMLTFMTFGVGFFMRPLGAIFLGAYIDHHGRRKGLIFSLSIMAMGTLLIAVMPTYNAIGLWAPFGVLLGRLLQGFSAGAELGGVSVYLSEIATPRNRGFYVSWQSASQQMGVLFAALFGVALFKTMPLEKISVWGWRIPFVFGCFIIPLVFLMRKSLEETSEFKKMKQVSFNQILRTLWKYRKIIMIGMMLTSMTTANFYLLTVYAPTYAQRVLNLSATTGFIITACVALSNFFWLPISGALSDKIGRKPILWTMTCLSLLTAYPLLSWLAENPTFIHLLVVQFWFSFIYGGYNGTFVATLVEIMPAHVRVSGFSLAYSLATAIFGGLTPLISTFLIQQTNNKAAPAFWLMSVAILGFLAVCFIPQKNFGYDENVHAS